MSVLPCLIGLMLAAPGQPGDRADLDDPALLLRAATAFRRGVARRGQPEEARKAFAEAAAAFATLEQRGLGNPELYRDQGNACLLAGQLPEAVLAFRRGLRRAPADQALQQGLEAARDQVNYPATLPTRPPPPSWPAWLPWPTSVVLLRLALAAHALAWAAGVCWLVSRRNALAGLALLSLVATVLLGSVWGWQQWDEVRHAHHPLVVVAQEGAGLYLGNGVSYPRREELPVLARGMEARGLYQRGDWLQIEIPGGLVGWVRRGAVLLDVKER